MFSYLLIKLPTFPRRKSCFPVKAVVGVTGGVVCLRGAAVCCACLSFVLVVFGFGWGLVGWLPCWERASHSALEECCRKNVLLCFMYFLSHLVSMLGH